jgi:hypothetical protein
MSKKNHQNPSNPQTNPTPETPRPTEPETAMPETPTETATQTQPDAVTPSETVLALRAGPEAQLAKAPEADPLSMAYMIPALPHMKDKLARLKRVDGDELASAVDKLQGKEHDALQALIGRLNPQNDFLDNDHQGLTLNLVKMDQGAGDDPAKPANSVKGALYTKPAGELLTVPPQFGRALGLPDRIRVYVLGMYNGRSFFTPRDEAGNPQPLPGIEVRGNAPICVSFDRKVGNRFDECGRCMHRPFANGSADRNACKDNVDLFVCTTDLTNIFRIGVAATSFKTSTGVIAQKLQGRANNWDISFEITTEKKNPKPGQEFYVLKASTVVDNDHANGVPTPETIKPLLGLFARQILTELHLPRLAGVYAAAKQKGEAAQGARPFDASPDDIAAAAAAMDYSRDGTSGTI